MIGTLVIKEIHENIVNIRFLVVSLLCIILVPAGMFVGLKDYEYKLEDYNMQVNSYIEICGLPSCIAFPRCRYGVGRYRSARTLCTGPVRRILCGIHQV